MDIMHCYKPCKLFCNSKDVMPVFNSFLRHIFPGMGMTISCPQLFPDFPREGHGRIVLNVKGRMLPGNFILLVGRWPRKKLIKKQVPVHLLSKMDSEWSENSSVGFTEEDNFPVSVFGVKTDRNNAAMRERSMKERLGEPANVLDRFNFWLSKESPWIVECLPKNGNSDPTVSSLVSSFIWLSSSAEDDVFFRKSSALTIELRLASKKPSPREFRDMQQRYMHNGWRP